MATYPGPDKLSEDDELLWSSIREMLGLTDLPFQPQGLKITQRIHEPAKLEITFRRELTSYELEQYRRISMRRPWPSPPDSDA